MPEPLYRSHADLSVVSGLHRRARIPLGQTIELGVHGPIKDHYKLAPERDLPLPVDYIVAAAGG